MDTLRRRLTSITGSAAETEKQLVRLREIAKLPGVDFEGAIAASANLQNVGFSAEFAERSIKAFANAVALSGGGQQEFREVNVQLQQIAGSAKVVAQDLRPILAQAPAVAKAVKNLFGTVESKAVSEQLKKAGIDTKGFIQLLVGELERLPKVTAGAKESFENLAVSARIAGAKVGAPILRIAIPAIEKLIPKIESAADAFERLSPTAQKAWLPVTAPHRPLSVAAQEGDGAALLHHYRAALAFRRGHPTLRDGGMEQVVAQGDVFSFVRTGAETVFCAFNLGPSEARLPLPEGQWERIGETVGSVAAAPGTGEVRLPGWGCCIARRA